MTFPSSQLIRGLAKEPTRRAVPAVAFLLGLGLHHAACSSGTDPEEGHFFGSVIPFGFLTEADPSPAAGATVTLEGFHGPSGAPGTREGVESSSSGRVG